jgi:hypothetical protein
MGESAIRLRRLQLFFGAWQKTLGTRGGEGGGLESGAPQLYWRRM